MERWDDLPQVERREGEPMSRHTTFRIGGPARVFLLPKDREQAAQVLRACGRWGVRPFFLGNGSNLLVPDEGYDGVVLSTGKLDAIRQEGEGAVYAESGVLLSRLASFAAEAGLTGLEFAGGIPGSLGGAVRMNAGAYGGEMVQVVERVDALDKNGQTISVPGKACGFRYRHSIFCERPWLITGALLRLTPGDREAIRERMGELARRRREKQPLDKPSAGSTFKRPAPVNGEPRYAAALIDQCGLKGLTVGGAQVSEKHAGFVVNLGNATCADVTALMAEVRRRVEEATGVVLEPEVEILK